jgi:hypothetical protein
VVLRAAVVARLSYEQFVAAEQGMLRTFGRIMPVLMPLSGILSVALIYRQRLTAENEACSARFLPHSARQSSYGRNHADTRRHRP